jgi:hypothetical protein
VFIECERPADTARFRPPRPVRRRKAENIDHGPECYRSLTRILGEGRGLRAIGSQGSGKSGLSAQ